MTRKQKRILVRIIVSGVLFCTAILLPGKGIFRLVSFLIPYLLIGYDVMLDAARGILHGQLLDEKFLMVIASVGAIVIGEYPECVAVMLFFQIGELFQGIAVGRSRRSIAALMDICPDFANVERGGQILEVFPDEVSVGETVIVRPGEKIPIDGTVIEGCSGLDTAALTGESVPRDVSPGSKVFSGCICINGLLKIRTTHLYQDSTVAKILELVENSSDHKSRSESFVTRFAHWYTPAVVIAAVLLGLIPPLLFGQAWQEWLKTAIIFLVVSCPCALVISVPLSFFAGIGGASRRGILIKGSNYLETLAKCDTAVFDKTGTLTEGSFTVTNICPADGFTQESLLEYAALAEMFSTHPIARSLAEAYGKPAEEALVGSVRELSGLGICTEIRGDNVCVGSEKYMRQLGCACAPCSLSGTAAHVCVDGTYAGYILISDTIKQNSADAIGFLKSSRIRTVMLTGDRKPAAAYTAEQLGIDEYHAELLPADKVAIVEQLIADGRKLIFTGDGINDAPVLARADVGIAMGKLGTDAAIEAADIVIMDDNPAKLSAAIKISRKTLSIVRQNVVFSLAVKFAVMLLSIIGFANMWLAVIADVGVCVAAILNAMRAYRIK